MPAFKVINLEDIASPQCLDVETSLKTVLPLIVPARNKSDNPNQTNNMLSLARIFRGLIEVRARGGVNEQVKFAAAAKHHAFILQDANSKIVCLKKMQNGNYLVL